MLERAQTAGQWVFLRIEAGFNAAFGDRLNPFYHLGEITFFLFWIVAASGLYLYAFFETGVTEAYSRSSTSRPPSGGSAASCAACTATPRTAWWSPCSCTCCATSASTAIAASAGSPGSPACCCCGSLYVSGINGFMLPWDRLAQFVVVATAELLDWLPIFNGALMRNFIYQASVNDRLFSLLSFMHIGVPLVLLLFMWIHIQRVPKASTNPPRAIALPLLGDPDRARPWCSR